MLKICLYLRDENMSNVCININGEWQLLQTFAKSYKYQPWTR